MGANNIIWYLYDCYLNSENEIGTEGALLIGKQLGTIRTLKVLSIDLDYS